MNNKKNICGIISYPYIRLLVLADNAFENKNKKTRKNEER